MGFMGYGKRLWVRTMNKLYYRVKTFSFSNDYHAVRKIWEDSGPGVQLSSSDEPVEIIKKLKRDHDLFLVAEDQNGNIVGAVMGGFDGRRGMVYHLAVSPKHRNNHIGMALMEELEIRLSKKGCLKYYSFVTHENQESGGFYKHLGFEQMDVNVYGKCLG